ncbi:MAG: hypothetical protein HY699_16015 [Deltaproteobacteria bacterium]|nr:hypothetical protein [Deltaproteobacteria bacterium]
MLLRAQAMQPASEGHGAAFHAADDLRNLQAEERKRHEATWCAQGEAHRAIEKFTGRIQGRVRAIVEGRG